MAGHTSAHRSRSPMMGTPDVPIIERFDDPPSSRRQSKRPDLAGARDDSHVPSLADEP